MGGDRCPAGRVDQPGGGAHFGESQVEQQRPGQQLAAYHEERKARTDKWQYLVQEQTGIAVIESVVLHVSLLHRCATRLEDSRCDKHPDHRRNRAFCGEVVEHRSRAHIAVRVQVPPTVIEEHHGALLHRRMASWPMYPDGARCPGKLVAGVDRKLFDDPWLDPVFDLRVGTVHIGDTGLGDRQRDERHLRGHRSTLWERTLRNPLADALEAATRP